MALIYRQDDKRWARHYYPNKNRRFKDNGCGCCSVTHLIIGKKKYAKLTPDDVRKWMISQKGIVTANGDTTDEGISKSLRHYGYEPKYFGTDAPMSKIFKELAKGNRKGIILFSAGKAPDGTEYTIYGHFIAFTAYKKVNGKHYFYLKDSAGWRRNDGWHEYSKQMKSLVDRVWVVEKNLPKKKAV